MTRPQLSAGTKAAVTAIPPAPVEIHCDRPTRVDYAYALVDGITARTSDSHEAYMFTIALERLGYVAADPYSSEKSYMLRALRKLDAMSRRG